MEGRTVPLQPKDRDDAPSRHAVDAERLRLRVRKLRGLVDHAWPRLRHAGTAQGPGLEELQQWSRWFRVLFRECDRLPFELRSDAEAFGADLAREIAYFRERVDEAEAPQPVAWPEEAPGSAAAPVRGRKPEDWEGLWNAWWATWDGQGPTEHRRNPVEAAAAQRPADGAREAGGIPDGASILRGPGLPARDGYEVRYGVIIRPPADEG